MLVIFGAAPANFTNPVSVAASAETAAAAGAAAAGVPDAVLAAAVVVVCSSSSPSSSLDASLPLPQAMERMSVVANNRETNFFIVIDLSPVSNVRLRRLAWEVRADGASISRPALPLAAAIVAASPLRAHRRSARRRAFG